MNLPDEFAVVNVAGGMVVIVSKATGERIVKCMEHNTVHRMHFTDVYERTFIVDIQCVISVMFTTYEQTKEAQADLMELYKERDW